MSTQTVTSPRRVLDKEVAWSAPAVMIRPRVPAVALSGESCDSPSVVVAGGEQSATGAVIGQLTPCRSLPCASQRLAAVALVALAFLAACGGASPHQTRRGMLGGAAGPALVPIGAVVKSPGLGSMTVTKSTCGLKRLPYAAPRGSSVMLNAAPGNRICLVVATFTNTETAPRSPAPFATLLAANGQSYREDATLATMASLYAPHHPSTSTMSHAIEPGQSVEYQACYQVPASTKASSLAWPATSPRTPQAFVLG